MSIISNTILMKHLSDFQDKMDSENYNGLFIHLKNNPFFKWINETKSYLWLKEDTHTYFYVDKKGNQKEISDDVSWSATKYMKYFSDEFNYGKLDINPAILRKAAADGTRIHKQIEDRSDSNFERQLERLFNITENNFREVIIWSKEKSIVGMIDIIDFEIKDNELNIKLIDHKVTKRDKTNYLTHQLNIYAYALSPLIEYLKETLNIKVNLFLIGNIINKYEKTFEKVKIESKGNDFVENIINTSRGKFTSE